MSLGEFYVPKWIELKKREDTRKEIGGKAGGIFDYLQKEKTWGLTFARTD